MLSRSKHGVTNGRIAFIFTTAQHSIGPAARLRAGTAPPGCRGRVSFGSRERQGPLPVFFFQTVVADQGPSRCYMNFRVDLFISAKNNIGILTGIALKDLNVNLGMRVVSTPCIHFGITV